MDILAALSRKESEIDDAEVDLGEAEIRADQAVQDVLTKRTVLDKLREQRGTLIDVARQYGALEEEALATPTVTHIGDQEIAEWQGLSRLDAVERILREAIEPRHISEIVTDLQFHGREGDDYALVSASLSNLRSRRQTVVSLGRGKWEYIRAGTNTGRHPVMDQMADETRAALR